MNGLKIEKTRLEIGVGKPMRILQISDAHICRAYPEEGKQALIAKRTLPSMFGDEQTLEERWQEALRYAKSNCDFTVFTGDIYDFFSRGNLDYVRDSIRGTDFLCAAGNHDFFDMEPPYREDEAYKRERWGAVADVFGANLWADSRRVGDVNLVTLDDTLYQFGDGQKDYLEAECAKGLPILLFLHVPIATPRLAERRLSEGSGSSAYLVSPDEALLSRYRPDRRAQQQPSETTRQTVRFIEECPQIKAVFAGHLHWNFEEPLSSGIPQYTTGALYDGIVREIEIV